MAPRGRSGRKKMRTFDGPSFWKNAYAHQRAALLRMIGVPEDKVAEMSSTAYLDLPVDDIETSPDVDVSGIPD